MKGNFILSITFNILFVFAVLFGLIIQFGIHVILGEEPVVSTFGEFGFFVVISLIVIGGTILLIRYRKGYLFKVSIILISTFLLNFWFVGIMDTISYSRTFYLVLIRYLGLITTLIIIFYSTIRIFKEWKSTISNY